MDDEELLDNLHAHTMKALDMFCANCMVCTLEKLADLDVEIWEGHSFSFIGEYDRDVAHTIFNEETHKSWIECNLSVLRLLSDEQRYNEMAHEMAHAIEFHLFGTSDHGERWASTHKLMGGNGLPGCVLPLDK